MRIVKSALVQSGSARSIKAARTPRQNIASACGRKTGKAGDRKACQHGGAIGKGDSEHSFPPSRCEPGQADCQRPRVQQAARSLATAQARAAEPAPSARPPPRPNVPRQRAMAPRPAAAAAAAHMPQPCSRQRPRTRQVPARLPQRPMRRQVRPMSETEIDAAAPTKAPCDKARGISFSTNRFASAIIGARQSAWPAARLISACSCKASVSGSSASSHASQAGSVPDRRAARRSGLKGQTQKQRDRIGIRRKNQPVAALARRASPAGRPSDAVHQCARSHPDGVQPAGCPTAAPPRSAAAAHHLENRARTKFGIWQHPIGEDYQIIVGAYQRRQNGRNPRQGPETCRPRPRPPVAP